MNYFLKVAITLSVLFCALCLSSCHKVSEGNCWIEMTEDTGHVYPVYYSRITKSSNTKITFSGADINGTLHKKGKSVNGSLTIGNDATFLYTFVISIKGTVSGKMNIDGTYTGDGKSGTFKIKL